MPFEERWTSWTRTLATEKGRAEEESDHGYRENVPHADTIHSVEWHERIKAVGFYNLPFSDGPEEKYACCRSEACKFLEQVTWEVLNHGRILDVKVGFKSRGPV
jgi:hypothetical protein